MSSEGAAFNETVSRIKSYSKKIDQLGGQIISKRASDTNENSKYVDINDQSES